MNYYVISDLDLMTRIEVNDVLMKRQVLEQCIKYKVSQSFEEEMLKLPKWAASWENQQSAYAKPKAQISFADLRSWSAPLFSLQG